jgi:hypothetical protein
MGKSGHRECGGHAEGARPFGRSFRYDLLTAWSIAVMFLQLLSGASAFADTTDPCSPLDDVFKPAAALKASVPAPAPAPASAPATAGAPAAAPASASADNAATQAVTNFLSRPSPFDAVVSSNWVAGGDSVTVNFVDSRIAALKDITKVCVKAFLNSDLLKNDSAHPIPLEKVTFVTPEGKPQQLQVVLRVRTTDHRLYGKVKYTFAGSLTEPSPAITFAYSTDFSVVNKKTSSFLALLFVAFFYGVLARVTYDKDDVKDKKQLSWLVYVLSPIRISAGVFGEASLSQVQVVLFTFIVAGLLFQLWVRTGVLSDISEQLLILIGISAVGAGGAKFTGTIKTSLSDKTAQYLIGKGWYRWEQEPLHDHATLAKLLLTDNRLDVYKFQMAIFTVVVALYVIWAGQTDLSQVKISETMLYLIGISQGVYVGGKAITDRTTDLESAVAKMIDLEKQLQSVLLKLAAVPPPANAADLQAQRNDLLLQYAEAATTAANEFGPLTHRAIPMVENNIDPVYLKPGAGPPATKKAKTANNGDQTAESNQTLPAAQPDAAKNIAAPPDTAKNIAAQPDAAKDTTAQPDAVQEAAPPKPASPPQQS